MKVAIYQTNTRNKFPFNLFAIGIKYFSKTNYSHYAIRCLDNETGEDFVLDSTAMGVRKRPIKEFKKHNTLAKSFVCNKTFTTEEILNWYNKHDGKTYGFTQIVGLLLKILNIIKYNPLGGGSKRIICNELVVMFLNRFYAAGIEDTDSLDLNDTEALLNKVNI